MNTFYDSHFKKKIVTIYPGEMYVATGSEFISTILGSCVSIVLFDRTIALGGMNHFMLAEDKSHGEGIQQIAQPSQLSRNGHLVRNANNAHLIQQSNNAGTQIPQNGRFGQYAIDMLINKMESKGAKRFNLQAKVFGGTNVFNLQKNTLEQVGRENIDFALKYLEKLNIPIVAKDLGGIQSRKIIYDPQNFKVYLKRLNKDR